jgi:nucleoside-diphosphate-sugar epimerase
MSVKAVIFGAGNVGQSVQRYAKQQGADVAMLDRNSVDFAQAYAPDVLFLCAGPTGDFRTRVLDTFDAAVTQTIRLLRALKPKRVVGVSSVRIYGFRKDPIEFTEESPAHTPHQQLDFAYDGAKQALENILIYGCQEIAAEGVIVRLSNVVGGTIRDERAAMLHHAMRAARHSSAKRLETRQHLDCSKDYVHVDDVAQGLWLAATRGKHGAIYNIASGVALSVRELARLLDIELICTDAVATASHSRIAINKATNELGYQPIYADAEQIARAIAA